MYLNMTDAKCLSVADKNLNKEEAGFAEERQAASADLLWNDVHLPAWLHSGVTAVAPPPSHPPRLSCIVYDTSCRLL